MARLNYFLRFARRLDFDILAADTGFIDGEIQIVKCDFDVLLAKLKTFNENKGIPVIV